jgi:hypothetical protein
MKLEFLYACFLETSRIFRKVFRTNIYLAHHVRLAAGVILSRDFTSDFRVDVSKPHKESYVIRSGTRIIFDMVGIRKLTPYLVMLSSVDSRFTEFRS